MRKRLKKDIVIPAGTVFEDAPIKTERYGEHKETLIRLTNDMTGIFTVFLDGQEAEEVFEDMQCKNCHLWTQLNDQYGQCGKNGRYMSKDAYACFAEG